MPRWQDLGVFIFTRLGEEQLARGAKALMATPLRERGVKPPLLAAGGASNGLGSGCQDIICVL